MNDKDIIISMGNPSLDYKIVFDAMQKARQDERKRIKDILQHAYDNLINNKNYLCFFGYLPKKQKEKNDILLKMFDARFDEIVFIYSDIMGISFNNAKKELEMNREIDYEYE